MLALGSYKYNDRNALMMRGRVVFGEVICPIQTALAPKNVKLTLPHAVTNPIEMHVNMSLEHFCLMESLVMPEAMLVSVWMGSVVELQFWVHLKENQQLKYLNRGSTHTEICFQAIPSGVLMQLAVLTMRTEETESVRMDILYPSHVKALKVAKLAPEVFLQYAP